MNIPCWSLENGKWPIIVSRCQIFCVKGISTQSGSIVTKDFFCSCGTYEVKMRNLFLPDITAAANEHHFVFC